MKKKLGGVALGIAIYVLLLILMVFFEGREVNSSINGFGDALWYSLVTLTTVGYGDMYPVSAVGKAIGIIFVFCSLGLLSTLIAGILSFISGSFVNELMLKKNSSKSWYVFCERTDEAVILARDIRENDKEAIILFCTSPLNAVADTLTWTKGIRELATLKKDIMNLNIFFMSPEEYSNFKNACEYEELGCNIYCMSENYGRKLPENVTMFSTAECVSRRFWQKYPVSRSEKSIVLIGMETDGEHILERGLLNNIFETGRKLSYHVFAGNSTFKECHYSMDQVLAVNQESDDRDELFFHSESWQSNIDLIINADRIIICGDDEGRNLSIYEQLKKYYPVKGVVYVKNSEECTYAPDKTFGKPEDVYTTSMVMKQQLNSLARRMNDIYRASADFDAPGWEELSEFTRQSNIAAADHVSVKIGMLLDREGEIEVNEVNCKAAYEAYLKIRERGEASKLWELEHRRWMRFHAMNNWKYAEVRNNDRREHNMMIPFEELSLTEQKKDDYAWNLLKEI